MFSPAITVYAVISILNLLMFTPNYLKERRESESDRDYDAENDILFFIIFIPVVNFVVFIILFIDLVFKYFKFVFTRYHQKKYPEIVSLDILEKIYKIYENEVVNQEWVKKFTKNFSAVIELLNENHRNPEISHLLLNYEVTLTRILTILKESKQNDKNTFNILLVESKKTIELFEDDILYVKNKFDQVIFDKEEKLADKIFEELEIEVAFQQKRVTGLF
jgi:hypothetical protein